MRSFRAAHRNEQREVLELAISDAQRRAVAKYNAANYDRVELRLEKGKKEIRKRDIRRSHISRKGKMLAMSYLSGPSPDKYCCHCGA